MYGKNEMRWGIDFFSVVGNGKIPKKAKKTKKRRNKTQDMIDNLIKNIEI